MGRFRELKVWQRAKELAVHVYKMTAGGHFARDLGLRDQIRRAAVSMPSNIAEGDELGTDKQAIRRFFIAKGSAAELLTQLIIANEIGYVAAEQFQYVEKECQTIAGMLSKLIQARTK
jgi:four helix bundle protein